MLPRKFPEWMLVRGPRGPGIIAAMIRRLLKLLLPLLCAVRVSLAADLTIGLAADVSSLDPHYLNVATNNAVATHFFDTLVQINGDGKLVPGLAESWRAISPTTWEFHLRKGVKFHDGSTLTAEDVLFSLDRPATLTASPGPFTPFTKLIVEKKAVDPYTIRISTAQPEGTLPLDMASIFVVSRKAASQATTDDFNQGRALVGTGPFRFVRFRRGEAIDMARHDAYWGPKAPWDKVTLRILTTDAARLAALLSGQVDLIEAVPPSDVPRLKADRRFQVAQRISWRTLFLQLDQFRDISPFVTDAQGRPLPRNPLKDARVRRALSKAIQRQALCDRTLEGLGIPASNLVVEGIPGYTDRLKVEPYDPDGAKVLLKEAGYPDGFRLTIHGPNNRYIHDDQILQTLAQFFSRIGIRTQVEALPLAAYFGRLRNGDFSVGLLGWGSLAGDSTLRNIVGTPDAASGWGVWNWPRYSNPTVDRLVHEALSSTDDAKRRRLAAEAMETALKDTAVIPLHHQLSTWGLRRGLHYDARVDEFSLAQYVRPDSP